MYLTFVPIRSDAKLCLARQGDVLIVNGEPFDFSTLPEGAFLPPEAVSGDWLAGDVTRTNGDLKIPVLVPHSADAAPQARQTTELADPDEGPIPLDQGR